MTAADNAIVETPCRRCGGTGEYARPNWRHDEIELLKALVSNYSATLEPRFTALTAEAAFIMQKLNDMGKDCIRCAGSGKEPQSVAEIISVGIRVRRGGA